MTERDRKRQREMDSGVQERTSGSRNESERDRGRSESSREGQSDRPLRPQGMGRDGDYVTQRLQDYSRGISINQSQFTEAEFRDYYSKNPLQKAVFHADQKMTERLKERGIEATSQRVRLANVLTYKS